MDPSTQHQQLPHASGEKWRAPKLHFTPETAVLSDENPTFDIDCVNLTDIDPAEFGLRPDLIPSDSSLEIAGVITLGATEDAHDTPKVAILKESSNNGAIEHFTLVTKDADGKPVFVQMLSPNTQYVIGRKNKQPENHSRKHIDGNQLGIELDDSVSREHVSIVLRNEKIEVTDMNSLNGTTVEAVRRPGNPAKTVGAAALHLTNGRGLIDSAPLAPSDSDQHVEGRSTLQPTAEVAHPIITSPEQQKIDSLTKTIAESNDALAKITEAVQDKEDLVKLWAFGVKSGYYRQVARREERGDLGPLGHRHTENAIAKAHDAERALPASVKPFAAEYRTHMVNKMLAQSQLDELR